MNADSFHYNASSHEQRFGASLINSVCQTSIFISYKTSVFGAFLHSFHVNKPGLADYYLLFLCFLACDTCIR